jgi:site-specific recombinase XerD
MSECSLQNLQSGPGGPGRARVGHGPLSRPNYLQDKDGEKWTALQPEIYPKEDTYPDLLRDFLSSGRAEGRTVQALIGLKHRVPKLLAYLDEAQLDLFSLKARDAQTYIGWLSAQRTRRTDSLYSARTVACYFEAASTFHEYLKRRGLVFSNPFKEVRRVRCPKRIPRGLLKESEMEALLDELSRFDEQGHLKAAITRYKLHVVAELMYSTGMRVSEAASLKVSDIDFSRSLVTVKEAKGGFQRVSILGEFAREVLRLYVEKMRPLVFSEWNARNEGLLFGTGWGWFGKVVNAELSRACAALGLPPMRSHGFRHAVGYHLLRAGCNIRHIQSILGHRKLRNTEVYTKVEKEDLKNVVDSFHPRKWKAPHVGT